MRSTSLFLLCCLGLFLSCSKNTTTQPVYEDVPYWQDYSVKYYSEPANGTLLSAHSDRNGVVKILSSAGLFQPYDGQFLYHGKLQTDGTYRPLKNKKIAALGVYENQFVYLDDKTVLSNAWAGKLFSKHALPAARIFAGGKAFTFLVSDGKSLQLLKDSVSLWKGDLDGDEVVSIRYQAGTDAFWILGKKSVYTLAGTTLTNVFQGATFTAFDLSDDGQKLFVGTPDGYIEWDVATKKQVGDIRKKLPWTEITAVEVIGDKVWFGTTNGAFALRADGKFDYYNGERWLPGNSVVHIAEGPNKSVLVLTSAGLGQICFKQMTLHEKAMYYEEQVRSRHIRNGFNASLDNMEKGNIASGYLADSDNDGLWTSMYLGGEIFRYAVTKDADALQNCREALDAMERLYTINPVPGFPSRSFERSGYIPQLSDPERWQHSSDPEWDWKATTSSDEAVGHIFAFGAMAELIDDPDMKNRAITLIDTLMSHIVKNNYYLIDYDGKPTTWGRWSPEYVNAMPKNVGDRKITSSNITAMLQTAYHFTKKEKYKEKAFELMQKHGYLENLMRPMKEIGPAPGEADDLSKLLSDGWNHSDDEMYFVSYWGLYRYAFNDTLKAKYKEAILDHWAIERPEKEGAWNIFTALTGTSEFDLNEAAWYLREHPLDLIDWAISNSHRKDIEKIAPNFRNQTLKEVLPPDERPVQRHNGNMFTLDRTGSNGTSEHSAGDIWLLPYWMGRYLNVISAPKK
ncbi:hypothetical protein [Runella slithyformis]|uniref:WD40 repeat domain-containing protein n=1 Tax=Runella slithyformis (strain ATCC 29530 / DSM 19594 / LMG 11500 / NCIMB 11436 / LSU 4) TaxID=761193 RepID=A0A7U3ZL11_RUNSL|nr:hypothetical protein [Runella slithyformis]AEI49131.1 hypothetical protein Runsl_2734 [Runella slithyformis DSM 19594]